MSTRARSLAERCFALARSTTFAGERDAAIARGTAIAEKAGLSLDLFDIPGRSRAAAVRPAQSFQRRSAAPEQYTAASVHDAMARFNEAMARQSAEVDAREDETIYDARRRNFERAATTARARDEHRKQQQRVWEETARKMDEHWDAEILKAFGATGAAS